MWICPVLKIEQRGCQIFYNFLFGKRVQCFSCSSLRCAIASSSQCLWDGGVQSFLKMCLQFIYYKMQWSLLVSDKLQLKDLLLKLNWNLKQNAPTSAATCILLTKGCFLSNPHLPCLCSPSRVYDRLMVPLSEEEGTGLCVIGHQSLIFHSRLLYQSFHCPSEWNSLDHLLRHGHHSCLDDGVPLPYPYCGDLFHYAANFQYVADSGLSKSACVRKDIKNIKNRIALKYHHNHNSHTFPKIKKAWTKVFRSPEVPLFLQGSLLHDAPRAGVPSVVLESWRHWVPEGTDPAWLSSCCPAPPCYLQRNLILRTVQWKSKFLKCFCCIVVDFAIFLYLVLFQ